MNVPWFGCSGVVSLYRYYCSKDIVYTQTHRTSDNRRSLEGYAFYKFLLQCWYRSPMIRHWMEQSLSSYNEKLCFPVWDFLAILPVHFPVNNASDRVDSQYAHQADVSVGNSAWHWWCLPDTFCRSCDCMATSKDFQRIPSKFRRSALLPYYRMFVTMLLPKNSRGHKKHDSWSGWNMQLLNFLQKYLLYRMRIINEKFSIFKCCPCSVLSPKSVLATSAPIKLDLTLDLCIKHVRRTAGNKSSRCCQQPHFSFLPIFAVICVYCKLQISWVCVRSSKTFWARSL